MVVRDNGKCLVTNSEYYTDSFKIIYLIKYTFEYLFGACKLFVISNLLLPSLHSLVMVVIVKPSEVKNGRFKRHQYAADVLMHRSLLLSGERKYVL